MDDPYQLFSCRRQFFYTLSDIRPKHRLIGLCNLVIEKCKCLQAEYISYLVKIQLGETFE